MGLCEEDNSVRESRRQELSFQNGGGQSSVLQNKELGWEI